MNGYDLLPDRHRRSLLNAYNKAQSVSDNTLNQLQRNCVEDCLNLIEQTLNDYKSPKKEIRISFLQIPNISHTVCELVSTELKKLEIGHSFIYNQGCHRESAEITFTIKL